jgi:hypothetical protein
MYLKDQGKEKIYEVIAEDIKYTVIVHKDNEHGGY